MSKKPDDDGTPSTSSRQQQKTQQPAHATKAPGKDEGGMQEQQQEHAQGGRKEEKELDACPSTPKRAHGTGGGDTTGSHAASASGGGGGGSAAGGPSSTQITLAISHRDAVRMLDASRAFNEAVRGLQREEDEDLEKDEDDVPAAAAKDDNDEKMVDVVTDAEKTKAENEEEGDAKMLSEDDDKDDGGGGAGGGPEVDTDEKTSEEKKKNDKKKKKTSASASAPPTKGRRTRSSRQSPPPEPEEAVQEEEKRSPSPAEGGEGTSGADESRTEPSPSRPGPDGKSDAETKKATTSGQAAAAAATANDAKIDEQQQKKQKGRRRRRTPLHKLLVPAAERCPDRFITSYLRRMRDDGKTDMEIEACLLLFLDMDKSTKLLTAFEVLGGDGGGGGRGRERGHDSNDDKKNEDETDGGKVRRERRVKTEDVEMDCDADDKQDAAAASTSKADEKDGGGAQDMEGVVTTAADGESEDLGLADEDEDEDDEIVVPGPLTYEATATLFRSFLTSISTCIHRSDRLPASASVTAAGAEGKMDSASMEHEGQPTPGKVAKKDGKASPRSSSSAGAAASKGGGANVDVDGDVDMQDWPWTMSSETEAEIGEIARFAADQLARHARDAAAKAKEEAVNDETSGMEGKEKEDAAGAASTAASGGGADDAVVSFEAFGNWYNSGGFKLVPWLELLDLAKWDFAGRAAAAAVAAAAGSDRHAQGRRAADPPSAASADPLMGPIAEEDDFAISPDLFLEGAESTRGATPSLSRRPGGVPAAGTPHQHGSSSGAMGQSRTVVSFDFTGAMPSSQPFQIRITEENLRMLKNLVTRTGLSGMSPNQVCEVLLRHSETRGVVTPSKPSKSEEASGGSTSGAAMVLTRDAFGRCIRDIVDPAPDANEGLGQAEVERYSDYFSNFFACFDNNCSALGPDCVNAKELAVGFSFLCAGNKSSKLATAYELLDDKNSGYLTQQGLTHYLRSYLTMLVGISLLTESTESMAETRSMLSERRRTDMFTAVENGARWTKEQFVVAFDKKHGIKKKDNCTRSNAVTFEDFAEWYTEGGYTVAPWLELLDLTKFLSLINDSGGSAGQQQYRRGGAPSSELAVEVMFTFPLANHQSLVVLREDATYVRSVVTQLCLSSMTPEELWTSLYGNVKSKPLPPLPHKTSRQHKSGSGKSMDVDQTTFVSAMEGIMRPSRKRPPPTEPGSTSPTDTLKNFFQSFDLHQVDRVAANELMGGLTLLCGGKKSMKLAFAFSLFDGRPEPKKKKGKGKGKASTATPPPHSLDGKELFLFLRSFLIVMFSCCKQSLDLSAEEVSRYIYDTAHVIAEDVMKFQWQRRKSDRVDFDQFGEWYNEGGFETAPWLELLDLNKWVLSSQNDEGSLPYRPSPRRRAQHETSKGRGAAKMDTDLKDPPDDDLLCPPPPPDDALDAHDPFFGDDIGMDGMDGIEDMDFQMIAQEMNDKENVGTPAAGNAPSPRQPGGRTPGSGSAKASNSSSSRTAAPTPQRSVQESRPPPPAPPTQPLKFHLLTSEEHGGYMVSISQRRVRHLRQLVVDSGLCKIDAVAACSRILEHGVAQKKGSVPMLTKDRFDSAMRAVVALAKSRMTGDTQRHLSELLTGIFSSFDPRKKGEVSTLEVAAGFSVLCGGRKSDKLEFAFDLLDMDKDGKLNRRDMATYLQAFLTVLLGVSTSSALDDDENEEVLINMKGGKCSVNEAVLQRVIVAGSDWATQQVYTAISANGGSLTFDDFADWYTRGGYTSIPWLELLDLRKWVLAAITP